MDKVLQMKIKGNIKTSKNTVLVYYLKFIKLISNIEYLNMTMKTSNINIEQSNFSIKNEILCS